MTAQAVPLRFQVGARTLASVPRRLVRVPLSLASALTGEAPVLPPLAPGDDGYLVTSLPAARVDAVTAPTLIAHVRQRYTRYYVDLAAGEASWRAGLSANARSTMKRKARKLAALPGFAVRAYRSGEEIAAFHPQARGVSATTYQERLMDAGLPADPAPLLRLAAGDRLRAWLLVVEEAPIAYLCCSIDGDTVRYDQVGHDPRWSAWSPGSVLQEAALVDLFAEARFARFDFTEGEGQHKRQLATGGVDCVDLLLLRRTPVNRTALAALGGFDAAMAWAKRAARHPRLAAIARRVRR